MELVLNTFGTMLNRDNECFVVRNDAGRQRVPTDGVSSILVTSDNTTTDGQWGRLQRRDHVLHYRQCRRQLSR